MDRITNIKLEGNRFIAFAEISGEEYHKIFPEDVTAGQINKWFQNRIEKRKELEQKELDLKKELIS